jgi:hypothetical protein
MALPTTEYTFAVKLSETITIAANSEDEARGLLARGYSHGLRHPDYMQPPRIIDQEHVQHEITLLSAEDREEREKQRVAEPRAKFEAEFAEAKRQDLTAELAKIDAEYERDVRATDAACRDFERQLNDAFAGIRKRLEALEARVGLCAPTRTR